MAKKTLTQATYAVNNIQNQPDQVVGSASALKLAFDQGDIDGKTFINGTLLTELADETLNNSGSNAIGHNSTSVTADNVGDALEEIKTQANTSVQTSGDQTVNGIKTFSSSPLVPTPTLDGQAANKSYVDSFAPLNIADNSITDQKLVDSGGIKSAVYDTFYSRLAEWYGNTKLADDGQDDTAWSGATPTADTTNKKLGKQSVQFASINGTVTSTQNNMTSFDLTKLNNGGTVQSTDYIVNELSADDQSLITSIAIQFSSSATFDASNYHTVTATIDTNGFKQYPSLYSTLTPVGSGADLTNVQSMRLSIVGTGVTNVNYQYTQLVKKDPLSAIPNPFQRNGVRDFTIGGGDYFVGLQYDKVVWKILNGFTTGGLLGQNLFDDFIISNSYTTESSSANLELAGWFTNTSNYVSASVASNVLFLRSTVGGVSTDVTTPFAFLIGDKINAIMKKTGTNITLEVYKNGHLNKILTNTTTLTSGKLAFEFLNLSGTPVSIDSSSITQIAHAHHADEAEVAKSLVEQGYYRARSTANQSIPNNVETKVVFGSVVSDNRGFFVDGSSHNITESGVYLIDVNLLFSTNTSGHRNINIRVNNKRLSFVQLAPSDSGTGLKNTALLKLNANDVVEIYAKQTSGGALDIVSINDSSNDYSNTLSIAKVG